MKEVILFVHWNHDGDAAIAVCDAWKKQEVVKTWVGQAAQLKDEILSLIQEYQIENWWIESDGRDSRRFEEMLHGEFSLYPIGSPDLMPRLSPVEVECYLAWSGIRKPPGRELAAALAMARAEAIS